LEIQYVSTGPRISPILDFYFVLKGSKNSTK